MAEFNIGKAPANNAVIPFYATGAVALIILCLLLILSADSLTGHYFNPHLLTIVHTAVLGWATMIIFGAAHQLLPVVCERDLNSSSLAVICWYTLTVGVILLAYSFWDFQIGIIMIIGGSCVVFSALMFLINAIATTRLLKQKPNTVKLFIVSSAIWLLITTSIGLLLALNFKYNFFTKNHLEVLKFHAHAGIAGWFLQLISGISSKLVPMFLLGKTKKEFLLRNAFIFQNIGLILFLADGYLFGFEAFRSLIYAILVIIGIAMWLAYLYDCYKNRLRKKIDIQMKHTFISFLFLLLAILFIPLVLWVKSSFIALLYGSFIFLGWISGIILGKTFKTLPFIIWNEHYKKLTGKVKVPLPKDLYIEKLVNIQFWLFIIAMIVLAIGIVLSTVIIVRIAAFIWLLVSLIYFYNIVKILFHKTKIL